jgi:dolichyl-phosphate beta-glucosyltransferase
MTRNDQNDPVFNTSISLVIPAYNEEKRLATGQSHVFAYLQKEFPTWEVIYVDDGSTDNTYKLLLEYQKQNSKLKVLRHEVNCGKGKAVRTGLEAAKGKIVLFSDADFSTPIEDVQKLISSLANGFDIAIGSRGVPGSRVELRQSFLRDTTGKIGNAIVQTLLLLPFEDTQCGFKLYTAEALRSILPKLTLNGFAFDMEMLLVAMIQGWKISEVPVSWRNSLESTVRSIHVLQVLKDVFKLRYRQAMGFYS